MRNESVAILDIRSYVVSFVLGSRGVNGTFVFCGSHDEEYDGFSKDGFFDEQSFRDAVANAVNSVRQNYGGEIDEVFVGVPSAFIELKTKGHALSFPSKRKITLQDIDALYESGLVELMESKRCIRKSNMYFTLGDKRKYFLAEDLYGVPTTLLQGALCYYFINDTFYELVLSILNGLGITKLRFLPTTLTEALYLLPEKRREGYAFLLDVGFLISSISVVYGNGIVHEETFDFGKGTLLVSLMENLDVEYETAEKILRSASVAGGNVPKDLRWTSDSGELSFPMQTINDIIKCGLDVLCERVEAFFQKYYKEKGAVFAVNPISITGEGIQFVAGATEHIAGRLNRLTEIVTPDLPYYDKPVYSSRMSLLNTALSDRKKRGLFYRIFNGFGGRKK